jgi:hypothetical protein
MKIQEKIREIMLSQEWVTPKNGIGCAPNPGRCVQNRGFESGDPGAQLTQLQGSIEAALALQQLDAEEFKKGQW